MAGQLILNKTVVASFDTLSNNSNGQFEILVNIQSGLVYNLQLSI